MTETPAPYDVVLGGKQGADRRLIALKTAILSAATPEERISAIAEILKYPQGLDIVKTVGTQWCVGVSLTPNEKYVAAIYEAVRVKGYESPYWFARVASANECSDFKEAIADATALSEEKGYPFFWEVGHLTRTDWGWVDPQSEPQSTWSQAYLYPVTESGNRIKFSGKTHFKKNKLAIATEPDRIGMSLTFKKRQQSEPMELWRTGIEQTPDERLKDAVTRQLIKALEIGLINSYEFSPDAKSVHINYGGVTFIDSDGVEQLVYTGNECLELKYAFCFLKGMASAKIHLEKPTVKEFWDAREIHNTVKVLYQDMIPEM